MPTVPVVEVSHLPSSASFYATVSQPLGIHFLPHTSVSTLDFGLPASPTVPCEVLFTLSESTSPSKSTLKFRALSQGAVTEFHWRALQANANEIPSTNYLKHTAEESIARITDLDGNMLEARFNRRNSAPLFATASTPKETRRVLDWQRDVAIQLSDGASLSSSSSSIRKSQPLVHSPRQKEAPPDPRLQRRETIATSHYQPRETQVEVGNSVIGGLSNQALIGTFLGAAAGAAIAYAMVKSEEPRRSGLSRPKLVSYHTTPSPISHRVQEVERTIEASSTRSESQAGSKARRPEEPRHVVKYNIVNGKEIMDEIDEEKSVSHRTREPEPSQAKESEKRRGGSEASKSSRHTTKSQKQKEQPTETSSAAGNSGTGRSDKSDREGHSKSKSTSKSGEKNEAKSEAKSSSTYVSARSEVKSHRSHASRRSEASTVKPEKSRSKVTTTLTVSQKEAVDRASEKAAQKASRKDSVISPRDIPLPSSDYTVISTVRSARHYPLPESVVTVAPSDSISSVGMKREKGRRRM
jgi:hypothetical protein